MVADSVLGEVRLSRVVVFAFSLVIVLWVGCLLVMLFLIDTPEHRGLSGDMFGSVNALFSGLAFVGITLTILLQRNELVLQRRDLALTRKELQRSAAAQESSEQQLASQAQHLQQAARLTAIQALLSAYEAGWEQAKLLGSGGQQAKRELYHKTEACIAHLESELRDAGIRLDQEQQ